MKLNMIAVAVATLLVSAFLTGVVRKFAFRLGLLDVPNRRSSHRVVTPRGGGVGIVTAVTVGAFVLRMTGAVPERAALALIGGGIAVATIGFLDDRRPRSVWLRLSIHLLAAIWAVECIGGLPAFVLGDLPIHPDTWTELVEAVGIVWILNLFNFMDGIDGIAASEAAFVTGGGAVIAMLAGGASGLALGWVVGAACVGFLVWNWPPAKIFMGDVGSGYLGYAVGVLAAAAAHDDPNRIWIWLILGGVFFVDATVTLVRRLARGERVYEAHRSHAYQWLSRRWNSHKKVTVAITVVNVGWLFPCAVAASRYPRHGASLAMVALVPLIVVAVAGGAGRREGTKRLPNAPIAG